MPSRFKGIIRYECPGVLRIRHFGASERVRHRHVLRQRQQRERIHLLLDLRFDAAVQGDQPELLAALNNNAVLPDLGKPISQAHGELVEKDGQAYLPLYHPAAALYNGAMRETLLADFAKIPGFMDKITSAG